MMNQPKDDCSQRDSLLLLAAYVLLVVGILFLPGRIPYETVRESGPIETLSALGYFYFVLFLIYFNYAGIIRTSLAPAFFVLLLGLRELDFHARFTTMGMFKSRFFISPEVPPLEKGIVVIFILLLLAAIIVYLRRVLPDYIRALKQKKPYAVSIGLAVSCAVVSKMVDGNSELFEVLLPMVENPSLLSRVFEECLELFIPIFLVQSLIQYSREYLAGTIAK